MPHPTCSVAEKGDNQSCEAPEGPLRGYWFLTPFLASVYEDGRLFLTVDQLKDKPELANAARFAAKMWDQREKKVVCYDLNTNGVVWRKPAPWVAPLTLAVSDDKVFFFNGKSIVALDKYTADQLWASKEMPGPSL